MTPRIPCARFYIFAAPTLGSYIFAAIIFYIYIFPFLHICCYNILRSRQGVLPQPSCRTKSALRWRAPFAATISLRRKRTFRRYTKPPPTPPTQPLLQALHTKELDNIELRCKFVKCHPHQAVIVLPILHSRLICGELLNINIAPQYCHIIPFCVRVCIF